VHPVTPKKTGSQAGPDSAEWIVEKHIARSLEIQAGGSGWGVK